MLRMPAAAIKAFVGRREIVKRVHWTRSLETVFSCVEVLFDNNEVHLVTDAHLAAMEDPTFPNERAESAVDCG